MTPIIRPLDAYIPHSEFGNRVVGPPRATLSSAQIRTAKNDPLSFRYVLGRKAGTPIEAARQWIDDRLSEGALVPIHQAIAVYRQRRGDAVATGVIGDLSLRAYEEGLVKRHEKTIAKTLKRMSKYMRTTRVLGNPAVMARPRSDRVSETLAEQTRGEPTSTFTTVDGISHQLWIIDGDQAEELCLDIEDHLYITDGHHRLAAAAQIARAENHRDRRIPVGVFSPSEFTMRSFARCVNDPDIDIQATIASIEKELDVEEVAATEAFPRSRYEYGARIGERHFRIRIPEDRIADDPYTSLNTIVVQDLVLGPLFGIEDPRHDQRLQFVADVGGAGDPCPDADAWFLPFPLEVDDVIAVADSGRTMPPKSTWFAPKLPSGLVIRPLDQD